jgi:hypothetical protein
VEKKTLDRRTDQDCRADNGSNASAKAAIKNDRKGLVDNDVGEEEGDQNPVLPLVKKTEHLLSAPPAAMRFVDIVLEDLEIDAVLPHEPVRRATHTRLVAVVQNDPGKDGDGGVRGGSVRDGQTRKGATSQHQNYSDYPKEDEAGALGLWVVVGPVAQGRERSAGDALEA